MTLILPTAYSTYGDATKTSGSGIISKYVLAQFRSDSDLEWVQRIRSSLTADELKWPHFKEWRPRLKEDRELWPIIENGIGQATIIIIDPDPIEKDIHRALREDGAEFGEDFNRRYLANQCSLALLRGTPVAYLPEELARIIPWWQKEEVFSLDKFTPEAIHSRIGQKLNDAKVFAARAHAAFDVPSLSEDINASTLDVFRSPLSRVILSEVLSVDRIFDTEHEPSLRELNSIVEVIANALSRDFPVVGESQARKLVSEQDSRTVDHLQAADLAAGWARELLELVGGPRSLADKFERVWVNGKRVR